MLSAVCFSPIKVPVSQNQPTTSVLGLVARALDSRFMVLSLGSQYDKGCTSSVSSATLSVSGTELRVTTLRWVQDLNSQASYQKLRVSGLTF